MKEKRMEMTQVLALLTLTVFALCLLLVLLSGAGVYRNLVDRSEENYDRRTALHYLTTRVRQADAVQIGALQDCEALILVEQVQEETFLTWIYCWDGWLWELYAVPGGSFSPEDGQRVLEADSLSCSLDGSLLTLELDQQPLLLHLEVTP